MHNLKENLEFICEFLKPILLIAIMVSLTGFLLSGFAYYTIQIDNSKLNEIRHCPQCGVDLINLR